MVDNLIRLFDSAETEFNSNGLGVLIDAESCFVSEEKNGEYELELVYPIKGRYFSDILMRRIIVAKPNPFDEPQPFRIYSITKPFNGLVTINAEHISYDLTGYPVDIFTATSCADALTQIKEKSIIPCPFDFWTDKDVSKEYSINKPFNIRSLLGGVDGSILSAFGKGEYEFDRYSVKLWLNRGRDRGVVIRYGKNLTDLKQEENCSSVYTGVCPFWYSENVGTVSLPEKIVEVEGTFNYTKILTLDLSDRWTDIPKEEDLRTAAQNYIKNNNIGVPDVSLDISFEQLAQTNEYKLYSLLEEVHLCDTVHVEFPDLGVSAKADCIKTIYNVLTNKYKKIELGSAKSSLASTIANQEKAFDESITKTFLEQSVDRATKLISGNAGGYVVMHNSNGGDKPNEILVMDTDDILTAKKVWRWNNSGLGYSNTGYNGLYGLAMTIDGEINADYITTGILNAISIRACDIKCGRIDETLVHMAGAYAEKEGTYAFELSSDGEIKATKGVIGKCTIDADGKLIVPAAHISGLLVANQIDASELKVQSANIEGVLEVNQIRSEDLRLKADQIQVDSESLTETLKQFVTSSGLSTELASYAPLSSLDDYETKTALTNTLKQYVTSSSLETTLSSYETTGALTETLKSYVTSSGLSTELASYAPLSSLDDYETKTALTNTLKQYVTSSSLETTLSSYETTGALTETLKSYVTSSGLSTELASYAPQNGGQASTFGYSLTSTQFKLTSNNVDVLKATSSGIEVTGKITASSGKIGNWTISTDEFYAGSAGITNSNSYKKDSLISTGQSAVRFYSGNSDRVSGKFIVLDDGSLYATAAKIEGNITANSGNIGGWNVSDSGLSKTETQSGVSTTIRLQTAYGSGTGTGNVETINPIIEVVYSGTSKFYVRRNGFVHAEDADVSGKITASSGSVAGINIGTETRSIEGTSVTGSVLKTPDADNNFSIFSYNYNGKVGSVLKVKNIDLEEPNFGTITSNRIDCSYVNAVSIRYGNSNVINLDYTRGGTTIIATLTNGAMTNQITVSLNKAVTKTKTFRLKLHVTWGGWKVETMTFNIGEQTKTVAYSGTFWGYDDAAFEDSGTKTLTFYEGGQSYIDFRKSIAPYSNDSFDIGSSAYKWQNIWATNGTIQTSDRNEKKDIVLVDDQERYDKLFDSLKPVTYRFKSNTYNRIHVGFIAQDIKESLDSLSIDSADFAAYCDWTKEDGTTGYGLRYGEFVALNTYEIQKLKKRVAELEQLLQTKKGEIQNGEC